MGAAPRRARRTDARREDMMMFARVTVDSTPRNARRMAASRGEPRGSRQAVWSGGPIVGGRANSMAAGRRAIDAAGTCTRVGSVTPASATSGVAAGAPIVAVTQQPPMQVQVAPRSCPCVECASCAPCDAWLCAELPDRCIAHVCSDAGSARDSASQRPHAAAKILRTKRGCIVRKYRHVRCRCPRVVLAQLRADAQDA